MIITTVEELRLHLPNHAYDDLESMAGAFRRSESNMLKDKIGADLYQRMMEVYDGISIDSRHDWLIHEGDYAHDDNAFAELTFLCQQVVVFDAFYRSADINAISVNQSGINVVDAENYDAASKDGIEKYKKQLNKNCHDAVNELLIWLEEAAKEIGTSDSSDVSSSSSSEGSSSSSSSEGPSSSSSSEGSSGSSSSEGSSSSSSSSSSSEGPEPEPSREEQVQEIVELWKASKYYYQVAGLFVPTATAFNEYVNIYESRERFVELLPDLRFCQRHNIANELGYPLAKDLLQKMNDGKGNDIERETIDNIREALCLWVETRSKMFNRPESKDEAIGSVSRLVAYVKTHQDKYDQEAIKEFPGYEPPKERHPKKCNEGWKNNRPGDALFVTPLI